MKLGIVYTFAPDDGATGGPGEASGGNSGANGTPAAQPTTPDAAAGGTTPAGRTLPVGDATGGQEPKFTQADVDRIIAERLDRVTKKYGDLDALKTAAEKLTELEKQQMTAQQRAEAERDEALKKAQAAEEKARARSIQLTLTTLLTTEHPQYIGREKYIVPLIDIKPDADDDAIVKAVTAAVKQFVQDVPIAPDAGGNREAGGSPPGQRRNGSSNSGGGGDAVKKLIAANFLMTSPIGPVKLPDQT